MSDLPPPIPDDDTPPPLPIERRARFLALCDTINGCGKTYPGDLDACSHCGASSAFSDIAPCDSRDWVYDIETYPNTFTALFIHVETGEERLFEISDRRSDWTDFCDFIAYLVAIRARAIGYNNIGFDYEVIHAIITRHLTDVAAIYEKAMSLINSNDRFGQNTWPSDWLFEQIDLYKIWHFDNRNKSTSLKALEIAMQSRTVVDLPFPVGTYLTDEQKDVLISYNRHDVKETIKFAARSQQQIHLREKLSERYAVNMLNMSNTKIGATILVQQMEAAGIKCFERDANNRKVPRQTHRAVVNLGDVIFPYVKFERPEFQQAIELFRGKTLLPADIENSSQLETKGVFKNAFVTVDGFDFVFGVGGIHGSVESQTVYSDEEFQIVDVDVTSFYPRMAIVNDMYPAHLGSAYCTIYNQIFDQRAAYPKGSPENAALKEALNASYGNSNNKYSPLYDPFYTMQTTINGQLMLCMLAEQLMKIPRLSMVQANTDGITVRCPRSQLDHMRQVCKWWEGVTQLQLEEALYSRMLIRDVNNYIAVYEGGKVKRKGAYEYETQWHQDPSAKVVGLAAEAALVHNQCPAAFIIGHQNSYDFMCRAKVPRNSKLTMRWPESGIELQLQGTTRYYVSNDGGYLTKVSPPTAEPGTWKRKAKITDRVFASVMAEIKGQPGLLDSVGTPWDARIHTGNQSKHEMRDLSICSGWRVSECADVDDFHWSNLDYTWYVLEASKLIDPVR